MAFPRKYSYVNILRVIAVVGDTFIPAIKKLCSTVTVVSAVLRYLEDTSSLKMYFLQQFEIPV